MHTQHNERQATAYGLAAVLLWSTVATAFKLGLAFYTPVQLLWLAALVSTTIFWGAALATGQTRLPSSSWRLAVLLGLINPAAYYLVLFAAYDRLPAQIAQPLNYTWAIALALLAVPVLGQRLSGRSVLGILIAYAGVVLLIYRGGSSDEALSLSGIVLALVSTLIWATYWLLNTRSTAAPQAMMAWSFTASLPPLTLWLMLTDGMPSNVDGWPYALWVGGVEMGLTFLLWQQALKRTAQVARISQLIFLSPFLSLLMIGGVLGEAIRWTTVVGLIVIVLGVALTQSSQRADKLPE